MIRCTELDDETHDTLKRIAERGVTKRSISKASPQTLAEDLDIPRKEMRMILEDLQGHGFLEIGSDSRILVHETCSCQANLTIVDTQGGSGVHPAHDRAGTCDGSSQGESPSPYGGGTSPPAPHRPTGSEGYFQNSRDSTDRDSPAPGRLPGRRGSRREQPPAETAFQLAHLLRREAQAMRRNYGIAWIGGVNVDAARSQIAQWLREDGITPAQVRGMIEEFTRTPAWIREGVPAWVGFVANRQALLNRVVSREHESGPRATELDWLTSDDAPIDTVDDWITD